MLSSPAPVLALFRTARGKISTPSSQMRKVCTPRLCDWPRILTTWILRTSASRCTCCDIQTMPSATVKMGLDSASGARYSDQEGGGQPARHLHAELLDEVLQAGGAEVHALGRLHHRTEGIDEHQAGRKVAYLVDDTRQHAVEVAVEQVGRQVDEFDRLVDLADVEEGELLLVAQHLQRRLAEHGEKQCAPFRRGQREHDLVRHRRLAAAGRAGQQVEGKLGDAATEQVVQARNSGGQSLYGYFISHCCGSLPAVSTASVPHAECKIVVVNGSPISRVKVSMRMVSSEMLTSIARTGVCSR